MKIKVLPILFLASSWIIIGCNSSTKNVSVYTEHYSNFFYSRQQGNDLLGKMKLRINNRSLFEDLFHETHLLYSQDMYRQTYASQNRFSNPIEAGKLITVATYIRLGKKTDTLLNEEKVIHFDRFDVVSEPNFGKKYSYCLPVMVETIAMLEKGTNFTTNFGWHIQFTESDTILIELETGGVINIEDIGSSLKSVYSILPTYGISFLNSSYRSSGLGKMNILTSEGEIYFLDEKGRNLKKVLSTEGVSLSQKYLYEYEHSGKPAETILRVVNTKWIE